MASSSAGERINVLHAGCTANSPTSSKARPHARPGAEPTRKPCERQSNGCVVQIADAMKARGFEVLTIPMVGGRLAIGDLVNNDGFGEKPAVRRAEFGALGEGRKSSFFEVTKGTDLLL